MVGGAVGVCVLACIDFGWLMWWPRVDPGLETLATDPTPTYTHLTDQRDVHELLPLQPHPHPPLHLPHRGVRLLGAFSRVVHYSLHLGSNHTHTINRPSIQNPFQSSRTNRLTDRPNHIPPPPGLCGLRAFLQHIPLLWCADALPRLLLLLLHQQRLRLHALGTYVS